MPVDLARLPVTAEAQILGRLHTLSHYCERTGNVRQLEQLHMLAAGSPAVGEHVVLQVECCLENLRSRHRPPRQAAAAWAALQARAERSLPPGDPLLMNILSRHAQYTARCGTPADLDEAVRLCLKEWRQRRAVLGEDHFWSRAAAADLAAALRTRSRNGDLAESLRLLRGLVADLRKQYGADHPFVWTAKIALAQTLVALAEVADSASQGRQAPPDGPGRAGYAAEAVALASELTHARHGHLGRDDPASLRALLVHAHAQILLGETGQALREIRYVKTAARRTAARLDDGWAGSPVAAAEAAAVRAAATTGCGAGPAAGHPNAV